MPWRSIWGAKSPLQSEPCCGRRGGKLKLEVEKFGAARLHQNTLPILRPQLRSRGAGGPGDERPRKQMRLSRCLACHFGMNYVCVMMKYSPSRCNRPSQPTQFGWQDCPKIRCQYFDLPLRSRGPCCPDGLTGCWPTPAVPLENLYCIRPVLKIVHGGQRILSVCRASAQLLCATMAAAAGSSRCVLIAWLPCFIC